MFSNLNKFSYKRNFNQAVGFYLFYLVLSVILVLCFGFSVQYALHPEYTSFEFGFNMGRLMGICISLFLSFTILYKKGLSSISYLFIAFLSGILVFYGTVFLGLIPVAYLSTKKPKGYDTDPARLKQ